MKKVWAIIGGGNGGQAMAGHLASMGEEVRLYDVVPATVDALNAKGGVQLKHAVEAFGKLQFATTDMAEAMEGANNIIVVLPSLYHESIAEKMIPNLKDGMVVFFHPEASCGALAFRKKMKDMGCKADVVVGAACTLLYSARITEPGVVYIFGVKEEVSAAALPASDNEKLQNALHPQMHWFKMIQNVLATSLDNINAMLHPAPMLLNTSRIEADPFVPFQYYHEGFTPSIGKFVETMDLERIAIAKAYGIEQRTIAHEFNDMYPYTEPDTPLYRQCNLNPGYEGIMCGNTLRTRYVLEDIPYSLVALRALAQVAGVETPCMDAIITLGNVILSDVMEEGRTKEALGIDSMTKEELIKYVNG